ncbi:MAG TPA: heparan-alpha-glucosaminide N-acetyltransferase domain-containing protein [Candidatus Baltobacteraceae bacterium]|nr:heparan-alpha-glucosaminide N-acetyltransferase domain-containing protein [Candidatus Baltobacteraceae bacterium]
MARAQAQRLSYIDWLRGLACFGMFEVHCYDSWLGGAARQSSFFRWSQLSGTIPAPLFIFLSGVTCALVADIMRRKGATPRAIAMRMVRRGAEVFVLGLLFRVQEFALGWPGAPWTDLGRVDVLNVIGLSLVMLGLLCWVVQERTASAFAAAGVATGFALLTPLIWTTWRPHWLPWYVESYVDGVHIYNAPQPWLFPIFPWTAFAFAGLAIGIFLFSEWPSKNPGRAMAVLGAGGVAAILLSQWFDARPRHLYATYDYWHTSPNFFLARVGIMALITVAGYAWCRWGLGAIGFSPFMQLGQTSLLVYWVHIEFVYGRFSILAKQSQGIWAATLGLIEITLAMVLLSIARTRFKGRGTEVWAWFRRLRSENIGSSPGTAAES